MKQLSIFHEQPNPTVRMHNYLVTAKYGYLELNAMRIFLIMIAKLKWDDTELRPIRIQLTDILPSYNGGNNLDIIKNACRELKAKMKDIEIQTFDRKGREGFKIMTMIDSVEYIPDTDYVEASFGQAVKPYLLELKGNFTEEELKELIKLKSSYAIRLFMLVKSLYREGQVYQTTVTDLKKMLVGNEHKYEDYRNFKKKVLLVAQSSLENTSSAFVFEEKKTGRNITDLTIKPKAYPKAIEIRQAISEALKVLLDHYKVNTTKICQMLESGEISEDYCRYVVKVKTADQKVIKPGGAIYKAITEKELWDEYRVAKPLYKLPLKAAEQKNQVMISYPELESIYQDALKRKRTTLEKSEWLQVTYISNGFTRVQKEDGWYIVKN